MDLHPAPVAPPRVEQALSPHTQPARGPIPLPKDPAVKLWIDDVRPPLAPVADWTWVKTSNDALDHLSTGIWSVASFDHDLGGDDTTKRVAYWLCSAGDPTVWPLKIFVHSRNPVGRDWLLGTLSRYCPPGCLVMVSPDLALTRAPGPPQR